VVNNLMIVDSITSPEGDILRQRTPTVFHVFEDSQEYLNLILEGMKGVVDESGTAAKYFTKWKYREDVAAKTGTAEVTSIDLENNSWFIMLAPIEDPEICVVVFIPSGLSGGESSLAAREFVGWYLDQKTLRTTDVGFPGGNMLAP
jgi:penicillin-binding protein 2